MAFAILLNHTEYATKFIAVRLLRVIRYARKPNLMRTKPKPNGRKPVKGFVRHTLTLPDELWRFAQTRKSSPVHAGSLSSYIRSLILKDQEKEAA